MIVVVSARMVEINGASFRVVAARRRHIRPQREDSPHRSFTIHGQVTIGVAAFLRAEHRGLPLRSVDEHHPSFAVNPTKCWCITSSLRWPLTKPTHGIALSTIATVGTRVAGMVVPGCCGVFPECAVAGLIRVALR